MNRVQVFGLLEAESYHIARCCAEDLYQKYPDKFDEPTIKPMLECEWDHFVDEKKLEIRGDTWSYCEKVMCFVNDNPIGSHNDLMQWSLDEYSYEDFRPEALYSAMAEEAYRDYFTDSEHKFAYLDISIDSDKKGRLLFELMSDICPKTCKNFLCLCTGSKGTLPSGLTLDYKNSVIHRIVPNGWIQGGDILHGRGDAGESIYGTVFEDENFAISHSSRGILGMVNKGRHTNASQFYVTLQPTTWMDCTYVAFGKLIEGTQLLRTLENLPTYNERPKVDCRVSSCGEYNPNEDKQEAQNRNVAA